MNTQPFQLFAATIKAEDKVHPRSYWANPHHLTDTIYLMAQSKEAAYSIAMRKAEERWPSTEYGKTSAQVVLIPEEFITQMKLANEELERMTPEGPTRVPKDNSGYVRVPPDEGFPMYMIGSKMSDSE